MNFLHRIPSIKFKLSIVIVGAVVLAVAINDIGVRLGWPFWIRSVASIAISLLMVQILARGMTRPLRAMDTAVARMAQGDYRHRIETSSVDEVGRLAATFNAMSAEMAKIDQERRDLVTNASHELRTPLAALRAQLENLIDGVSEPTPAKLEAMHAQTERLEKLVSRVMDLARIESGQATLHIEQTNVGELLTSAVEGARLRNPDATFELTGIDLASRAAKVDLDPLRIGQVLANLLDNAAHHAHPARGACVPSGEAVATEPVQVEARCGPEMLHIEVRDLGPGIDPDDASRVFERFYRADEARSTASGGAGLGLAIAHGIVEMHGGTIAAEVNHPHGCRMVLALPS